MYKIENTGLRIMVERCFRSPIYTEAERAAIVLS